MNKKSIIKKIFKVLGIVPIFIMSIIYGYSLISSLKIEVIDFKKLFVESLKDPVQIFFLSATPAILIITIWGIVRIYNDLKKSFYIDIFRPSKLKWNKQSGLFEDVAKDWKSKLPYELERGTGK